MSVKSIRVQEYAEELGYSTVQEAMDNGVEVENVQRSGLEYDIS